MRRLLLTLAIAAVSVLSVPMSANADDNAIAQYIMKKLKAEQQRGNLKGFHVDMRVDKGTVWFEGYCASKKQETLIFRTAQSAKHLGVVQIIDDIEVRPVKQAPRATQRVSYQQNVTPMPQNVTPPMGNRPGPTQMSRPVRSPMGAAGGPMPVGYTGHGAAMATDHPQMPGYAWPGYAAHPNYAAVTYPKQYSPTAWPYIGPFYPYPQVPLGWRKVTLEWDDGWWYLDFNDR